MWSNSNVETSVSHMRILGICLYVDFGVEDTGIDDTYTVHGFRTVTLVWEICLLRLGIIILLIIHYDF